MPRVRTQSSLEHTMRLGTRFFNQLGWCYPRLQALFYKKICPGSCKSFSPYVYFVFIINIVHWVAMHKLSRVVSRGVHVLAHLHSPPGIFEQALQLVYLAFNNTVQKIGYTLLYILRIFRVYARIYACVYAKYPTGIFCV